MSETDATPVVDPFADGVPYGTRLTELASASPDKIAVITVASDGGERVLTLGQLESGANQWGWQPTASGAAEGRPGSFDAAPVRHQLRHVDRHLGLSSRVQAVALPAGRWCCDRNGFVAAITFASQRPAGAPSSNPPAT